MTQSACQSRFEQLMEIADRFARHLSGDREKDLPPGVLLLERDGQLHTVVFDGTHRELAATARDMVTRHHVTSVALIVTVKASQPDESSDTLYVLGETAEGSVAERRYRVQPVFRRRRLLPVAPDEAVDDRRAVLKAFRPLFVPGAVPAVPAASTERRVAVGVA